MIRIHSQTQLTIEGFESPFERVMDKNNRWVKLGACIPWDDLANVYYASFNATTGRPAKEARLVIGAVIIKHKLKVSDEETVAQIQENPYLQYFCGFKGFSIQAPFAPSLFVEIRKRMGIDVFEQLHQAIIHQIDRRTPPTTLTHDKTGSDRTSTELPEQNLVDVDEASTEVDLKNIAEEDVIDNATSESIQHQDCLILDATVTEQAHQGTTSVFAA